MPPNRPYKPHLGHSHDSAENAKEKSQDGGHTGRKELGIVPDGDVVFALFEDEVLG